jgi:hypothetical protein
VNVVGSNQYLNVISELAQKSEGRILDLNHNKNLNQSSKQVSIFLNKYKENEKIG